MHNILVTGANGQLGSEIQSLQNQFSNYQFFFTDVTALDITNSEAISDFCTHKKINTIINCAAYTAVDKAESEIEICNKINHKAAEYLAQVAKAQNIKLVHVSTDYVFDGCSYAPYTEDNNPNPINVYGKTKWLGEVAICKIAPKNTIIIRTSWVYSSFGNNFVKTMLRLAETKQQLNIIADQIGTPTYAYDLAKTILDILPQIKNEQPETYHYANEGICSWYDFAFEIFTQTKTNCKVYPIKTIDYPTAAQRPLVTVMDKSKIKEKYNIEIPHWKTSLQNCLNKL